MCRPGSVPSGSAENCWPVHHLHSSDGRVRCGAPWPVRQLWSSHASVLFVVACQQPHLYLEFVQRRGRSGHSRHIRPLHLPRLSCLVCSPATSPHCTRFLSKQHWLKHLLVWASSLEQLDGRRFCEHHHLRREWLFQCCKLFEHNLVALPALHAQRLENSRCVEFKPPRLHACDRPRHG
jgi:hypothetical protein